jgi:hypothetical protein
MLTAAEPNVKGTTALLAWLPVKPVCSGSPLPSPFLVHQLAGLVIDLNAYVLQGLVS